MSKKLLSLLLIFVLVFSLFNIAALAEPSTYAELLPVGADYSGKIVILHTNDVHGAIDGYAKVATLKKQFETANAAVILLDAGDYMQGKTSVSLSKGANAIELMNAVGYDAATLGNHEFDYGFANLQSVIGAASFKVLASNVYYNTLPAFPDANVTITAGPQTIGVFGLTTPEAATKANPAMIQGVTFDALATTAESQASSLSSANLVICLGHLGVDAESAPNRSTDLLSALPAGTIDLFIDGHSHTVIDGMNNPYATYTGPGSTMLVSTGTAMANVGVVVYDPDELGVNQLHSYTIPLSDSDGIVPDPAVKAISDGINSDIAEEYGQVFATSLVKLNGDKAPGNRTMETNLGDFVTDAMLWAAGENDLDVDGVITNGGGLRAAINAGDITKNDIFTVLPFGNTLALVTVTGAQLLEALEASTFCVPTAVGGFPQVSGINYTIDTRATFMQGSLYPGSTYYAPASINRVSIQSVGGQPFSLTAQYTIATNNFVAAGGDTYSIFTTAPMLDTGLVLDEIVMNYIIYALDREIGTQYAQPAGRIIIITGEAGNPTPTPAPTPVPTPAQPAAADVPKTGDAASTLPILLVAAAVMAALLAVKVFKRREN